MGCWSKVHNQTGRSKRSCFSRSRALFPLLYRYTIVQCCSNFASALSCASQCRKYRAFLERRQPKWVPAVLDPEHAEQEAVHAQNDASPDKDSDLLGSRVGHPGDFQRQTDGGEGEDAVCKISVSRDRCDSSVSQDIHIAATICVSNPY